MPHSSSPLFRRNLVWSYRLTSCCDILPERSLIISELLITTFLIRQSSRHKPPWSLDQAHFQWSVQRGLEKHWSVVQTDQKSARTCNSEHWIVYPEITISTRVVKS